MTWYYTKNDLKNTPSIRDGMTYEKECQYRKEGAKFIISAAKTIDLGYATAATGVVYFQRFYMFYSFREFPRYVTACTCLFLAGKVSETPKKIKTLIKVAKKILHFTEFTQFGDNPQQEIVTMEKILLQTIKFDFDIEHPYQYLLKFAESFQLPEGKKSKLQEIVQMAWTFINDSLNTMLCLQWEPEIIAVAMLYMSGKINGFEFEAFVGPNKVHSVWWNLFVKDVSKNVLEDICHQLLDLYSSSQLKAKVQERF